VLFGVQYERAKARAYDRCFPPNAARRGRRIFVTVHAVGRSFKNATSRLGTGPFNAADSAGDLDRYTADGAEGVWRREGRPHQFRRARRDRDTLEDGTIVGLRLFNTRRAPHGFAEVARAILLDRPRTAPPASRLLYCHSARPRSSTASPTTPASTPAATASVSSSSCDGLRLDDPGDVTGTPWCE